MTKSDARKNKSHGFFWLLLAIAALAILFLLRYGMQKYGEIPDSIDNAAVQTSESPSVQSPEELSGNATENISDAPFSGAFYDDDFAIPVTFKGVVLSQQDRSPIQGAQVRILAVSSAPEIIEKTSGADGKFSMDAPAAYRYELHVHADQYSPYSNDALVITIPEYPLEILLIPSLSLKGRVVDLQSQGIPGARVSLYMDRMERLAASAVTDAHGKFLFPSMFKGLRVQLEAFHPGFESMGKAGATAPADDEIILRMKPAAAAGSLVGTVSDGGPRPITGAKISLAQPANPLETAETVTDAKGEYRFARLREGVYMARCTADGFISSDKSSQPMTTVGSGKESRLDFSLRTGLQIRGAVINQKNEPVAGAFVMYRPLNVPAGRGMREGRMDRSRGVQSFPEQTESVDTDEKGLFQIQGLTEGSYWISIHHRDHLDFNATLQPSNQLQTLTLDSSLSVRGAVRNIQGAPIERFSLTFQSATGRFIKSFQFTTSDGYFDIRGLPRDRYTVTLTVSERENERYSGELDLQTSVLTFLMTGEKPNAAIDFRGGRGGRAGGPMGRVANPGRGGESNTLTIVSKAR